MLAGVGSRRLARHVMQQQLRGPDSCSRRYRRRDVCSTTWRRAEKAAPPAPQQRVARERWCLQASHDGGVRTNSPASHAAADGAPTAAPTGGAQGRLHRARRRGERRAGGRPVRAPRWEMQVEMATPSLLATRRLHDRCGEAVQPARSIDACVTRTHAHPIRPTLPCRRGHIPAQPACALRCGSL